LSFFSQFIQIAHLSLFSQLGQSEIPLPFGSELFVPSLQFIQTGHLPPTSDDGANNSNFSVVKVPLIGITGWSISLGASFTG
jgi:hypothetical protein